MHQKIGKCSSLPSRHPSFLLLFFFEVIACASLLLTHSLPLCCLSPPSLAQSIYFIMWDRYYSSCGIDIYVIAIIATSLDPPSVSSGWMTGWSQHEAFLSRLLGQLAATDLSSDAGIRVCGHVGMWAIPTSPPLADRSIIHGQAILTGRIIICWTRQH